MKRYLLPLALFAGCATTATGPRDPAPVVEAVGDMRPAEPAPARDDGDVFEVQMVTAPRAREVHATNQAKPADDDMPAIAHKRPLL
jgi:hypothetical protein